MVTRNIYDYVERLSELFRVDLRQAGVEYGLQPVQLEALHYLSLCNRFSDTPMVVAEYLGQTKGTVSQTLKVLESKGLLSKHTDANDKRVTHLTLTVKGRKLLAELVPAPMLTNACNGMTEKARQQVETALEQVLNAIIEGNAMKSFGVCKSCRYNSRDGDAYYCNLVEQPLSSDDVERICREHET
ncbi:MAG: MarR family winged helix-turn-helix transcriptional regulator [Candidatus Thiodiazotropha taylori]